jgi:hypothetical protein
LIRQENDTNVQFVDLGLHHLITPKIENGAIVAFGPHSQGLNLVPNFGIGMHSEALIPSGIWPNDNAAACLRRATEDRTSPEKSMACT